jgi:hypothetical protein
MAAVMGVFDEEKRSIFDLFKYIISVFEHDFDRCGVQ